MEVLASALFEESDGTTCVWLVDTSSMTVHRQPVKTSSPTSVGFLVEGLKAGQTVVIAGVHYLKEGQEVRDAWCEVSWIVAGNLLPGAA
jgi:hypothetical protein